MKYADIIVDISHENIDKTYQYAVPKEFEERAVIGALVSISFGRGNRMIQGYIVDLSDSPKIEANRIKPISGVLEKGLIIESHLINLASWIKENYGATMNEALKTVIPIKKIVKNKEKKFVELIIPEEIVKSQLLDMNKKRYAAKVRLLEELIQNNIISQEVVTNQLNISASTLRSMEQAGIIKITSERIYRNPVKQSLQEINNLILNEEQRHIVNSIMEDYFCGIRKTYLIHGITGSGKTEVYMETISEIIKEGKQVIMLIPEIALTYQTVKRFYQRFGDRISILNSRMSQGERYDQYIRAKNGEIDVMIGPRSALFTPFHNLGLIIIDEEHETSYKSEAMPKYHAREVAIQRAKLINASVVLGSATPSIESYKKAMDQEYGLFKLTNRTGNSRLPKICIVDLREELKNKNKSIFSRKLKALILERLSKKQQIMLFINRRGYAGFVSCRSCGHVLKCFHCDVSLTSHTNTGREDSLVCHYCGYQETFPKVCPSCGSPYIAAFGTGTQKVEDLVKKEFPGAKVLRMDTDTTSGKEGHEKILSTFANHEADILVGTQMIVKGHDFPNVTLVGIIAADLSLYAGDYRAAEKTFQLLVQASGRAGRGEEPGEVVIQTYNPNHYSITTAAEHDYEMFYQQEISYRNMLSYPPVAHILAILVVSKDEEQAEFASQLLCKAIEAQVHKQTEIKIIGPSKASLSKVNDIYRRVLYIKSEEYEVLRNIKNFLEGYIRYSEHIKGCNIQFDFDPMNSY